MTLQNLTPYKPDRQKVFPIQRSWTFTIATKGRAGLRSRASRNNNNVAWMRLWLLPGSRLSSKIGLRDAANFGLRSRANALRMRLGGAFMTAPWLSSLSWSARTHAPGAPWALSGRRQDPEIVFLVGGAAPGIRMGWRARCFGGSACAAEATAYNLQPGRGKGTSVPSLFPHLIPPPAILSRPRMRVPHSILLENQP